MRLWHISETTLGKFQVSTDIPMPLTEVKTSGVVNFVWKYCIVNFCEIAKELWFWWSIIYELFETNIF